MVNRKKTSKSYQTDFLGYDTVAMQDSDLGNSGYFDAVGSIGFFSNQSPAFATLPPFVRKGFTFTVSATDSNGGGSNLECGVKSKEMYNLNNSGFVFEFQNLCLRSIDNLMLGKDLRIGIENAIPLISDYSFVGVILGRNSSGIPTLKIVTEQLSGNINAPTKVISVLPNQGFDCEFEIANDVPFDLKIKIRKVTAVQCEIVIDVNGTVSSSTVNTIDSFKTVVNLKNTGNGNQGGTLHIEKLRVLKVNKYPPLATYYGGTGIIGGQYL